MKTVEGSPAETQTGPAGEVLTTSVSHIKTPQIRLLSPLSPLMTTAQLFSLIPLLLSLPFLFRILVHILLLCSPLLRFLLLLLLLLVFHSASLLLFFLIPRLFSFPPSSTSCISLFPYSFSSPSFLYGILASLMLHIFFFFFLSSLNVPFNLYFFTTSFLSYFPVMSGS